MSVKLNAQKVRQLRKDLMWSQEDLAEGSGLSLRTIQRSEKSSMVSIDTLKALSAAFNIPADDLVLTAGMKGLQTGTFWGFAGILVGTLFAVSGVVADAFQNGMSAQEAGISAGIIGLIAGLSCALIGYLSRRTEQQAISG